MRKRELVSVILLTTQLISITSAMTIDLDDESIDWKKSNDLQFVSRMTPDDSRNFITSKLNEYSSNIRNNITTSTGENESPTPLIMKNYGLYLSTLSWVFHNVYVDESTGVAYTIFTLPDGSGDINSVQLSGYIEEANKLTEKISEAGILNSTVDLSNGLYDVSDCLSIDIPTDIDSLYTSTSLSFDGTLRYFDYSILALLAPKLDITSSVNLALDVDNKTSDGGDTELLTSLYTSIPELDSYKVCIEAQAEYATLFSNSLQDYTYEQDGSPITLTAVSKQPEQTYTLSKTSTKILSLLTNVVGDDEEILDTVEEGMDALSYLTNAKIVNNTLLVPDNPEITNSGYLILAAGSVYDPFVSHACDEQFMEVITRFCDNSTEELEKLKFILQVVNKKKPIFVTTGDKSEWASKDRIEEIGVSEYRLATLQDLLQIDEEVTRAYAVVRGSMQPSQIDSSTFEYVNGYTSIDNASSISKDDEDNNDKYSIVASSTLTASSQQMSSPVMITSGRIETLNPFNTKADGYPAKIGGLTSMIIHNAATDVKGNEALENAEDELLFLNGLGDIVLEDNTIVLPAIANPIIYAGNTEQQLLNGDSIVTLEDCSYYPYTATFMNHYPSVTVTTSGNVNLSNVNDVGKYILLAYDNVISAKRITKVSNNNSISVSSAGGVSCLGVYSECFSVTQDNSQKYSMVQFEDVNPSFPGLYSTGFALGSWFSNIGAIIAGHDEYRVSYALTKTILSDGSGYSFFPCNPDTEISISAPLVTSARRYISKSNESTGDKESTGVIDTETVVGSLIGQGVLGSDYTSALVKNFQVSYEALVSDQHNRLVVGLSQLATSLVDSIGTIDGVLAIKDPYENYFFNLIMVFIQEFYLVIAVALMIIVAIKFLKGNYNLIYVVFLGTVCACGFEVYTNFLPVALPQAYNFLVNDMVESISWNTVAHAMESYDTTYKNSGRKDPSTGEPMPYTATITLAHLSVHDMEKASFLTGTSMSDIKSGDIIYLDEGAGIYIQGNQIKMSMDKLFANNAMRGLYASQWAALAIAGDATVGVSTPYDENSNQNPYSIQVSSTPSLEAYYMPYNEFQLAFLQNLNTFSNIFKLERKNFAYADGIYKDAFIVSSFLNSAIFTAPEDDEVLKENIAESKVVGSDSMTVQKTIDLVHEYLSPQEDWLNLRVVFNNPSDNMKESLWGSTMQVRGWYDNNWNITELGVDKLDNLILYINTLTKQFIIEQYDMLGYCSDENAIKIISLYATTCFTHYVSDFGTWLYPNYINASELQLKDILYGSMTTLKDRNFSFDGNVVNSVTLNIGFIGIIFVILITLLSVLFIFVITHLIPILYGLFGILLLIRLITEKDSIPLARGYIKTTVITIILYFIYSLSLRVIEAGGYKWYAFLASLVIVMACCYILLHVLAGVLMDITNLGDSTVSVMLKSALNKITRNAVEKITAGSLNVNNTRVRDFNSIRSNLYHRTSDIDRYNFYRGSRRGSMNNDTRFSLSDIASRVTERQRNQDEYRRSRGLNSINFRHNPRGR